MKIDSELVNRFFQHIPKQRFDRKTPKLKIMWKQTPTFWMPLR